MIRNVDLGSLENQTRQSPSWTLPSLYGPDSRVLFALSRASSGLYNTPLPSYFLASLDLKFALLTSSLSGNGLA